LARLRDHEGLRRLRERRGIAAPDVGLRLQHEALGERLARRIERARTFGERDGRVEVAPRERALRGDREEAPRALAVAAAIEVLAEHERIALTGLLEPLRREAMAETAIFVREHRVCGVAHERVAERI